MGLIHPGAPKELTRMIKRLIGAQTFVETGTAGGDTAFWAANEFDRVISVEADPGLYRMASERLRKYTNVELYLGDSEAVLAPVAAKLSSPAIFWLDAHWSGPGSAGEHKECPLLQEIASFDHAMADHVIMIDDARLFLNPPGQPLHAEHWPSFEQVSRALRRRSEASYILVHDDVIVQLPARFRRPVELYLLALNAPGQIHRVAGRLKSLLRRRAAIGGGN